MRGSIFQNSFGKLGEVTSQSFAASFDSGPMNGASGRRGLKNDMFKMNDSFNNTLG